MIPHVRDLYHGDYDGKMPPFAEMKAAGTLGVILKASEGGAFTPDRPAMPAIAARPARPAIPKITNAKTGQTMGGIEAVAAVPGIPAQAASKSGKWSYQDPTRHDRAVTAANAGLLVGFYHFLTNVRAGDQVKNFLDAIDYAADPNSEILLAVDYEKGHNTPSLHVLMDFIKGVELITRRTMVIYGSDLIAETITPHLGGQQAANMAGFEDFIRQRRLWIAAYGRGPKNPPAVPWPWNVKKSDADPAPGIFLWQYTASTDGTGDCNYYPLDPGELAAEWSGA